MVAGVLAETGAGVGEGVGEDVWGDDSAGALWAAAVESSSIEKKAPLPVEEDVVPVPLTSAVMVPLFRVALVNDSTVMVGNGLSRQIFLRFQQFSGHLRKPGNAGVRTLFCCPSAKVAESNLPSEAAP